MANQAPPVASAAFVRESCHRVLAAARAGRLATLRLDESRLDAVVDAVIATTRAAYPTLDIPFHARWRHFRVGGRDLWAELDAATVWPTPRARLAAAWDLAIVSVLLDAGAGMGWRYREPITGQDSSKSEGLALASLAMFRDGAFSANPSDPLRVDAARLRALSSHDLEAGFQVSAANPLVGLEGRAALLRRLATVADRPSDIAGPLLAAGGPVSGEAILGALLDRLGPIWPKREGALPGAGDVWFHPEGLAPRPGERPVVAFHKLSQWLAYSLIEPLQWIGIEVGGVDGLTGLPEYRNGGLLLDLGVLALVDPADAARSHAVGSPLVIEWRALTVALLDVVGERVRARLGLSREALPLAKVLEGGTWATGRRIARERRADGGPPLAVVSDGTVF